MQEQTQRHYEVSDDPIMQKEIGDESVKDIRLAVYEHSVSVWKELAGVRFKLLALLPAASIAILAAVLTDEKGFIFSREIAKLGLTLFGFFVTLALKRYDLRNSQLYDDLISRSRRAEYELGVHTGAFLGRPSSLNPNIQHDRALKLVYNSCLVAWLGGGLLVFVLIIAHAV
jgi:hypothetical protein